MYRRYYSYNNMPTIAKPAPYEKKEEKLPVKQETNIHKNSCESKGLFEKFQNDDLILLIVIFVLLYDNCEDSLLLLALAFIFFNS